VDKIGLSRDRRKYIEFCIFFFLSPFDKETTADTRQLLLRDDVYDIIMVCVCVCNVYGIVNYIQYLIILFNFACGRGS